MKRITYILLLLTNISLAQTENKFLEDFLLEDKLKPENSLTQFNQFDFSEIWSQTENHKILGIIGADHQRIKIKLTSIKKNPLNSNQYIISGKSNVKETICDFSGTIELIEIKETQELHFGVDNEYKDKGIKAEGILISNYEFKENPDQKHSGVFRGKLYSKWYLNSDNQIKYDDIQSISDEYMNNAFVGIWKSYSTNKEKICNWADFRVPQANQGFDIGAAEFSPAKEYYDRGWDNYQKAWLYGNTEARNEELGKWWE